jgi:hypothetical protein
LTPRLCFLVIVLVLLAAPLLFLCGDLLADLLGPVFAHLLCTLGSKVLVYQRVDCRGDVLFCVLADCCALNELDGNAWIFREQAGGFVGLFFHECF